MQTVKKINASKTTVVIICCAIFLFLLLCNFLTCMTSDDFSYSFSWASNERIHSIKDIFPSLKAHYNTVNGRMIAHFFAQLFLLLPAPVFKVLNAGMFLALIWIMYRVCQPREQRSAILILTIFGLIWCTEPVFGEVNLWLDGACNYLWGDVVSFLYLAPIILSITRGRPMSRSPWRAALTMLLGFIAGAYLENLSAAMIFMTFLLLLLLRLRQKQHIPVYLILSFLLSILGFLSMALAPGERISKYDALTANLFRTNFITALDMYRRFWPLLLVLGILMILSFHHRLRAENRWVAAVLLLGSLAANFVFLFAAYYPPRGASYSVLLLVLAIGVLLPELMHTTSAFRLACALWALLLITSYQMVIGINDIYETYCANQNVITTIEACKQAGELDVEVPRLPHNTEYSIVSCNSPDPGAWPNTAIARYYGLHSIAFVQEP